MDLNMKLIDDVFKLIDSTKIELNSFKNDLNLEILGDQVNDLFNELHEFVISICRRRQQSKDDLVEFKSKRFKSQELSDYTDELNSKRSESQELSDDTDEFKNKRFKSQELSNETDEFKSKRFKRQESSDYTDELNGKRSSTDSSSYLTACEVLSDHLYEQMNKGKWFKISIKIRLAYGLIILYYVLIRLYTFSLNELGDDDCDFKDTILMLLNKIDNGLIYSPPFLNNTLAKCATQLHDYLITRLPIQDDYDQIYSDKYTRSVRTIDKSKEIKRIKLIDLDDFYENYFLKKIPCIIESAIDDWPALRKWNLNYLLNKSAYRLIPVEIGNRYTDDNWTQKVITVKEFIDQFIIEQDVKGYCAQYELFDRLEKLGEDFYIPDYCALSDHENEESNQESNEDVHINAWFGPSNTISPLHHDPKDNLLAQVFGSKYVRLYSATTPIEHLYVHDSNLLNNTSQVDIDNIDFKKYPNFPIEYEEAILDKGSLLYIPKKHWHYVRSTDLSFSISFWWK